MPRAFVCFENACKKQFQFILVKADIDSGHTLAHSESVVGLGYFKVNQKIAYKSPQYEISIIFTAAKNRNIKLADKPLACTFVVPKRVSANLC